MTKELAIRIITGDVLGTSEQTQEAVTMAVKALLMPPAQPERKKGRWTDDNACPFCEYQPWYERDIHTLSYCPNCGADMRGEEDDSV